MKNYTYGNENIEITFDEGKCCHAAYCFKELPEVFDGDLDPPIQANNASVEEIIRVIEKCPSSALTYHSLNNEIANETPDNNNTANTFKRGPLILRGDFELKGEGPLSRIALCRCGASKNKPFCDASHRKITFNAPVQEEFDKVTSCSNSGKIKLTPIKKGPIAFSGTLEFKSLDGKTQYCREKGALCRCGASKIKPFCDGNHRSINFETT